MDQAQREEELKKFEEHTELRLEQVTKRINRYFLALDKAVFHKGRIPLPDDSGEEEG